MGNSNQISCSQEKLGAGGFGHVFKGSFNGKDVAVKRILVDEIDETTNREEEFLRNNLHPNILKLFHAEKSGNFRQVGFPINHSTNLLIDFLNLICVQVFCF